MPFKLNNRGYTPSAANMGQKPPPPKGRRTAGETARKELEAKPSEIIKEALRKVEHESGIKITSIDAEWIEAIGIDCFDVININIEGKLK